MVECGASGSDGHRALDAQVAAHRDLVISQLDGGMLGPQCRGDSPGNVKVEVALVEEKTGWKCELG
jgi:hypothetical protein